LKGNESLSAVSKLLNDLRTDLEAKQIDADNEKTQILAQCKKDLENYSQRISLAVNEIKDSEFKAKRLNEAIEVYNEEIDEKQHQIEVLQEKDETLRSTRLQDSLDCAARVQQMKEMV
jgi:chromosome segregation ATPase